MAKQEVVRVGGPGDQSYRLRDRQRNLSPGPRCLYLSLATKPGLCSAASTSQYPGGPRESLPKHVHVGC